MGYNTEFMGDIEVTPPLPADLVAEFNAFCEERHEPAYTVVNPSYWCDWQVSEDGAYLSWNGSEKSYEMEKWLAILIDKFLIPGGHVASGTILAEGEDSNDVWKIVVVDNDVTVKRASLVWDD